MHSSFRLSRPLKAEFVVSTASRKSAPPPQALRKDGSSARHGHRLRQPICRGAALLHADTNTNRDTVAHSVEHADAYTPRQGAPWQLWSTRRRSTSRPSILFPILTRACLGYGCPSEEWREEFVYRARGAVQWTGGRAAGGESGCCRGAGKGRIDGGCCRARACAAGPS